MNSKPKPSKLTKDHKRLLTLHRRMEILADEEREIIKRIEATCLHPETRDSWWEWDSGYGTQVKYRSYICKFCRKAIKTFEAIDQEELRRIWGLG